MKVPLVRLCDFTVLYLFSMDIIKHFAYICVTFW